MPNRDAARERQRSLKRMATRIVAELPDDKDDALKVLEHAKYLVAGFINADDENAHKSPALRLVPGS